MIIYRTVTVEKAHMFYDLLPPKIVNTCIGFRHPRSGFIRGSVCELA